MSNNAFFLAFKRIFLSRLVIYGWLLGRFVHKSLDIVHQRSQDRNPSNINCKHFHEIPILGIKEWKNAK